MRTLSQRTKYALRALQALARGEAQEPVLISALAESEEIPKKFLELILLDLKNNGILQSKKGKGGGYFLRSRPEDITLGQIIRLFDGPLAPLPCVSEKAFVRCAECPDEMVCGTRSVMKEVRDAMATILDRTTLADVLKRAEALKQGATEGGSYSI